MPGFWHIRTIKEIITNGGTGRRWRNYDGIYGCQQADEKLILQKQIKRYEEESPCL